MARVRKIQFCCLAVFLIVVGFVQLAPRQVSSAAIEAKDGFRKVLALRESLSQHKAKTFRLPITGAKKKYSLTVSLPAPATLNDGEALTVTLRNGSTIIASKSLHAGDPDLYTLFKTNGGASEVEVSSSAAKPVELAISIIEWPESKTVKTVIEAEPNDTWREANEFTLGQTVWATADDKPYIPALDIKANQARIPYQQTPEYASGDALPEGGVDWFKFKYDGDQPKLVHFELDLPERDNLPLDVSIFKVESGETKPYEEGIDPVSPPHEVQALPGNKFTTRLITRGEYFVRVDANHVFYQLRTSVFDAPPYTNPQQAIRAGMDYVISAGDSWHANTPRHGGIVNRVSSPHAETQLCIACHATHFSTRAELTAKQNGYAVMKRSSMQFLTERLANNPRPFYGFPEASWTRVISASANVMSRLATLVNIHETEFSLPHNIALLRGVGNYLKIYYRGRTVLPNDETNGNTPIVSTYEVTWYSWRVFDQLVKLTESVPGAVATGSDREYRDRLRLLIEQDAHKNLIDLCYQTLAFAEIDRAAYADKIKRNAERILSLQREDGQWSMLFEPASTAVEFQTYHCLYTLARAGYKPDLPQIAKSLKFLLSRQQAFGGWFDPRQTYENFRTPFRETQFAVMALSEFYKGQQQRGWQQGFDAPPAKLAERDAALRLEQIDNVWDKPSEQITGDLLASLQSDEPMMRLSAASALGRFGDESAIAPLNRVLGDPSKMVQIVAAQAIRRIASRGGSVPGAVATGSILAALNSNSERTRWAATRIFAQHFAALAPQTEIADKL
ncbi:MAG: HEAT repeat domain-containing protein, partial [Acidobacteriota bacterium]